MNCILFGSGVYVAGSRSFDTPLGNVGAAILEAISKGLLEKVYIQSSSDSADFAAQKINSQCGNQIASAIPLGTHINNDFIQQNSIDAAIVSLPDHLHYQFLHVCASLNLHTITVKPFVETLAQAELLVEKFEQQNLVGCVEFHKRFDKANLLLKNKLVSQSISRIFVDYSQDRKVVLDYFPKWANNSNVFQYLGVHYVDLIHWMTGAQPVDVNAYSSGKTLLNDGVAVADNVDVIIKWRGVESEFLSVHLTSWAESHDSVCSSRQKIEVLTATERINSEQADRGFRIINNHGLSLINPYFSQRYVLNGITRYSGYGIDTYLAFFQHVLAIKQDMMLAKIDERLCTFSSALASVKVTEIVTRLLRDA